MRAEFLNCCIYLWLWSYKVFQLLKPYFEAALIFLMRFWMSERSGVKIEKSLELFFP